MKRKVLFVLLLDKKKSKSRLSGYFLPNFVKNPTTIASQYRDIPVKYETLYFKNGIVEHTFSLYQDYASENLYYLIQNHPLSYMPSYELVENPNVGLYYNVQQIISDYLYHIVGRFKSVIEEEGFTEVYVLRFEMVEQNVNMFKYVATPDIIGFIPKKVGFFEGSPANASIQITPSIHSLNLLLFSMLESKKALIDFYFSYLNIFKYYNGYPVQVMKPGDFLDKVFDELRKIFIEKDAESSNVFNFNPEDGGLNTGDEDKSKN